MRCPSPPARSWRPTAPTPWPTAWPCADRIAEALAVILKGADRIVQVSDAEIAVAMRAYYEDTHQLTEGAGAASLAALLQERERMKGKRVGLILSGGNIDRPLYLRTLAGGLRVRRPGEIALHRLHDEGRARAADARHAQQRLQGEVAEACEVGRQHMQQEIHVAGHGIAGHDLGPRADRGLEGLDGLLRMIVERHLHQRLQAEPHRRRRHQGGVAGDDAFLLQPLHPALAGRGRQPDLRRRDRRSAGAPRPAGRPRCVCRCRRGRSWCFSLRTCLSMENTSKMRPPTAQLRRDSLRALVPIFRA